MTVPAIPAGQILTPGGGVLTPGSGAPTDPTTSQQGGVMGNLVRNALAPFKSSKMGGASNLPSTAQVPTVTGGFNSEMPADARTALLQQMIARSRGGMTPPAVTGTAIGSPPPGSGVTIK